MATQIAATELPVIRAAGGILLRDSPGGDEVMIVFRAKHQDWTLPKGKLKEEESFQEAALREVEEETGCHCVLGDYLGMISYAHEGIPKVVMFWKMVVLEERPRVDGEEISEALWLPVPAALQVLTYAQERSLLTRVSPPRPPHIVSTADAELQAEIASIAMPEIAASIPAPEPVLTEPELVRASDAAALIVPEQEAAPLPEPSLVVAHDPEPVLVPEPEAEIPAETASAAVPELEAPSPAPEPVSLEPEFVSAADNDTALMLPEQEAAPLPQPSLVVAHDPEPVLIPEPEAEIPMEIASAAAPELEAPSPAHEPASLEPEFVSAADTDVALMLPQQETAPLPEPSLVVAHDPEPILVPEPEPEIPAEIASAVVPEIEAPSPAHEPASLEPEFVSAADTDVALMLPQQETAPLPEPSLVVAHDPEPVPIREPEAEIPMEIASAAAPELEAPTLEPEPVLLEPELAPASDASTVPIPPEQGSARIPDATVVADDDPEPVLVREPELGLHPEAQPILADIPELQLAASREYQAAHSREAQIVEALRSEISEASPTKAAKTESPLTSIIASAKRILPRPILRRARLALPRRGRRALEHELDSFRVEVNFLTSRDTATEVSWSSAVQQHYANAARCLIENDLEGGWKALRAAQRFAVFALTPDELSARAQVVRDEALKISSWRGGAIQRLLAVADDRLTHARTVDAILLRDQDAMEQQQRTHSARLRLQLLSAICIAGAITLYMSLSSPGYSQDYAPLLFAGLLGSAVSAAQQIVQARERGRIPGIPILLALFVCATAAGLVADPIYQYVSHYFKLKHTYDFVVYALAFILSYTGERILSHFAGYPRENVSVHY